MQLVDGVAGPDLHGRLREHGPGVHAVVDQVQRRAGDLHAVGEGVDDGMRTGEGGQQRRVGVDDLEPADERRRQDLHETGQHHDVWAVGVDLGGQRVVEQLDDVVAPGAVAGRGGAVVQRVCGGV